MEMTVYLIHFQLLFLKIKVEYRKTDDDDDHDDDDSESSSYVDDNDKCDK